MCVSGSACLMALFVVPNLEQHLMHMVSDEELISMNVFINVKVTKLWSFPIEKELLSLLNERK